MRNLFWEPILTETHFVAVNSYCHLNLRSRFNIYIFGLCKLKISILILILTTMPPHPVNEEEEKGLEQMLSLKEKFLNKSDCDERVRSFLEHVEEKQLLQFLRGRKCDPTYAWETLKRNIEVKLVQYPELFPAEIPEHLLLLRERPPVAVLKARDSHGRRIMLFNGLEWDPEKYSAMDLTKLTIRSIEKLLWDDDCINNGIMVLQNCGGLGFKHVQQYGISMIRLQIDIFLHSYPLQFKEVIFVNVPYVFCYPLQLVKFLSPKKLKERMFLCSPNRGFQDIYERLYPDILPITFGGTLTLKEAIDTDMSPF